MYCSQESNLNICRVYFIPYTPTDTLCYTVLNSRSRCRSRSRSRCRSRCRSRSRSRCRSRSRSRCRCRRRSRSRCRSRCRRRRRSRSRSRYSLEAGTAFHHPLFTLIWTMGTQRTVPYSSNFVLLGTGPSASSPSPLVVPQLRIFLALKMVTVPSACSSQLPTNTQPRSATMMRHGPSMTGVPLPLGM